MSLKLFSAIAVASTVAFIIAACTGTGRTSTLAPTFTPETPATRPAIDAPTSTPTLEPTATPVPTPTPAAKTVPEIIRDLSPSIVHIQTEAVRLDQFNRSVPGRGVGTGQVIDEKGHVLTNYHVIGGAERILVTLSDGRALEAGVVGGDAALDIAVLRVDAAGLVPIPIGSSSELQVGEQVTAIGHALDLPGGPTVTGGWISALDRSIDISETLTMQHLIQTDAAINPGNSGGPLVNMKGRLVGMNTAKLPAGEGIGFAIAIDPILPLIDELITNGKIDRGFLGASIVNINEALAKNFDLPVSSGVGVAVVSPDSPAERAGLQPEDIIVALAGKPVRNSAELDGILIQYRAGTNVGVEYYRGDRKRSLDVILGERPG